MCLKVQKFIRLHNMLDSQPCMISGMLPINISLAMYEIGRLTNSIDAQLIYIPQLCITCNSYTVNKYCSEDSCSNVYVQNVNAM